MSTSKNSYLNNVNLKDKNAFTINKEQFEVLKCDFCDDHIKRRFLDMKDLFYRIFKNFTRLVKLFRNKDEALLRKLLEDVAYGQKEFLRNHSLMEKMISIRINYEKLDYNKPIIIEGLNENEKREIFDDMSKRKELLIKFRRNVIELETISENIEKSMLKISMSNCLINSS